MQISSLRKVFRRKTIPILLILLGCREGFAAIGNVRVVGSTPRETILRFTAPTPASCNLEVSKSATYSPVIEDVDTVRFPGSNSDFRNGAQGRDRVFIIGAAGKGIDYAPVDANGVKTSRAQQADTSYFYRLTCPATGDMATGSYRTANIVPGDTFPANTAPIDPTRLGEVAWPFIPWSGLDGGVIDPVTGLFTRAFRELNEISQSTGNPGNMLPLAVYDESGTWTNKNNALTLDGTFATTTSNNPLKIAFNAYHEVAYTVVTGVIATVTGSKDASGTTSEICLMVYGNGCIGPYIPFTLPTTTAGAVGVGDSEPTRAPAMFGAWLSPNQQVPDIYKTRVAGGVANNVGSTITLRVGSNGAFDSHWDSGTHFIYDGVDYTVSSLNSGTELVISGSPANASNKNWTAANFGFLIRKTSGGGSISIDSVQMTYFFYASHQTNGGSGSTQPCTTQEWHEGWRIGGPTGTNTDAATNASPIVIRTTTNNDVVTGDIYEIHDVPGNTAANGTWTVTRVDANHFSLNGSTGNGAFPSDVSNVVGDNGGGIAFRVGGTQGEAPKGALCFFLDGGGNVDWYWVNHKVEPMDVRFLGMLYTIPHVSGIANSARFGAIDGSRTDVPTVLHTIQVSGNVEIWKGRYIGNQNHGLFRDIGTHSYGAGPDSDVWEWHSATPGATFTSKVLAFDADAHEQDFGFVGGGPPGYMIFSGKPNGGSQNGLLWIGMYDVTNDAVVALTSSFKPANCRWCGIHTLFAFPGTDKIAFVPYNLGGQDSGIQRAWDGPYRLSPTAALNNSTDLGSCVSKLTALGLSNPLNETGSNCSTVTLSSVLPITPSNYTPANDTRFNNGIRVGDFMGSHDNSTSGVGGIGLEDGESQRIVGISGSQIVITRSGTLVNHGSGWHLFMLCFAVPRWWDWVGAPHGETGTDPYSQFLNGIIIDPPFNEASHYATDGPISITDSYAGGPTDPFAVLLPTFKCPNRSGGSAPYAYRTWPWPDHLNAPASAYGCTMGNPGFGDSHGSGQGNGLEKHISLIHDQFVSKSFIDARPWGFTNTEMAETVTKVGTYLYKVTGYEETAYDIKRGMIMVNIGHKTSYDVSAPGFILPDTTAYNFTHCTAFAAGECFAGSTIREVYVNAPFVSKVPAGYSVGATDYSGQYRCLSKGEPWSTLEINDICVAVKPVYADNMVQYSTLHDPFNTGARKLGAGMNYPRTSNNLWNTPGFPQGNWLVNWGGILNNSYYLSTVVKVPPYPGPQRGINRGDMIPLPFQIPSGSMIKGSTSVYMRFGYNPSMFCTTRQERCVANAATIPSGVYSYETLDAPTGLSCTSGCTLVVPVLSQRILWTQLVYLNGSTVIGTGEVKQQVTP